MLRLEHVCVRWSLSVCVWGGRWSLSVFVCACVCLWVGGCVCVCLFVCVCDVGSSVADVI